MMTLLGSPDDAASGPEGIAVPRSSRRPPVRWRGSIESVLISRTAIARRVQRLAQAIERDGAGRELVVIPVLNGTVMFAADLLRHLTLPVRLDFLGVSSYRHTTSAGTARFTKDLHLEIRGRDVLLVDDILDSGQTLRHVLTRLRPLRPRRIRICVLLEKHVARRHRIRPHYVGFHIPNCFVVGYGLDFAERYRNLPFIGVLKGSGCGA